MTRFARARGSKACNEKTPEDSTPWEVMQQQLSRSKQEAQEQKQRHEAERKRQENYEVFLNEQKLMKKTSTWCDFPEDPTSPKRKKYIHTVNESEKQIKTDAVQHNVNEKCADAGKNKVEKNQSLKINKKKDKKSNKKGNIDQTTNGNKTTATKINNDQGNLNNVEKNHSSKINKKKDKKSNKKGNFDQTTNENKTAATQINDPENLIGYQRIKEADKSPHKSDEANNKLTSNIKTKYQNKSEEKPKGKKRNNSRENSLHIIINGEEVEIVYYDNFPIMKKDAERLDDLKTKMLTKGIPRSEIDRTMKLERRRAEKALARVKRNVCYNCRKGGHELSDCPDLKSNIANVDRQGDGMCFKCGSTEHRQFECKVQRNQEYNFASCFICKEQGHIARQCPDNPKGVFPNGGSCKHCGDVTHLKKDCPKLTEKRETTSVRLGTLSGDNDKLEDLATNSATSAAVSSTLIPLTKQPKRVNF